jgi:hypothetical protein
MFPERGVSSRSITRDRGNGSPISIAITLMIGNHPNAVTGRDWLVTLRGRWTTLITTNDSPVKVSVRMNRS